MLSKVCHSGMSVRVSRPLMMRLASTATPKINSLEDLASLDSLEGVDPELIRRLINEKTQELSTQDELKLLKDMQKEQERLNEVPLKRFTRPLWMFILMASTFYLGAHLVWWKLEYEEKEHEYKEKVKSLERSLDDIIASNPNVSSHGSNKKPWYKFW